MTAAVSVDGDALDGDGGAVVNSDAVLPSHTTTPVTPAVPVAASITAAVTMRLLLLRLLRYLVPYGWFPRVSAHVCFS